MTDDQTPGVAAMGEPQAADASAEIAYWTPKVRAYTNDELLVLYKFRTRDIAAACHDMPEGHLHSITNVELAYLEREVKRRLAAGPTLADKRSTLLAIEHKAWYEHDGTEVVSMAVVREALTALWPDGEHQADTVTINRADLPVFIDAIKAVQERHPEVRDYYQPYVDRLVFATARPHHADPQEAM